MTYNLEQIRRDFPAVSQLIHGDKPLVYLDNAATTFKPTQVIEVLSEHYRMETSNIHRGVHLLSEQATVKYEAVRDKVKTFIGCDDGGEIIFTSGTTEAINLVANCFGNSFISHGDEILITEMEHHSNIVPWQMFCERTGAILKVAPIDDNGDVIIEAYEKLLTDKTRLVSIVYVSNSLGTINPVKGMIDAAHSKNIPVMLDAAQAVATVPIDVVELDCEFLAFSAHKLFGPTGVGCLFGKKEILDRLTPYQGGGDMILNVTFDKTTYNKSPAKFEAGTPHIAGVIGMGAAIDYVTSIGIDNIAMYENELLVYATESLKAIDGIRLIGTAKKKCAIVSFLIDDVHPHDIGSILDSQGVAIRAGHHCTQPVMQHFKVPATGRASFSIYNTKADVDALAAAILKVKEVFV